MTKDDAKDYIREWCPYDRCEEIIKALERELKSGHWVDITNKNGTVIAVRCSCCGQSPKHAIRSDFCPRCGSYNKAEGIKG